MTPVLVLLVIALTAPGMASAGPSRTISPSEAIELAVENDSQLREAELNLSLATLELEAARVSTVLPAVGLAVDLPKLTAAGLGQEIAASLTASLSLPWGDGTLTGGLGFSYNAATSELVAPTWQISLADVLDLARPNAAAERIQSLTWAVESARRSYASAKADLVISALKTYGALLSEAQQADWDSSAVSRLMAELDQVKDLATQGYKGDQDVNEAKLLLLDAQVKAEKSAEAYAADLEAFCRTTLRVEEACQLSSIDVSMSDLLAAARSLRESESPEGAISGASAVIAAQQSVATAEDDLREARANMLPSVSVEATLNSEEWSLGVGLSLDLFDPSGKTNVEIAETDLELAKEKLDSARETVRDEILSLKASLLSSVRSAESLTLETEKWRLEEQVMTAKRAAGSISDSDWAQFLEEKGAFEIDAAGRATSLLVAHLMYRNALGMELNWEEWL
ncbi:MAG: TolC family protein [Thermotogota bacterium]